MAIDPHKGTSLTASFDELVGRADGAGDFGAGRILYVNNDTTNLPDGAEVGADVSSFGQDALHPLATIDYAIGLCSAGRGDKIIVLPGHAETITSAITLDVAGVHIEGRGIGAQQAQISCATASIDYMTVTAAGCKISGLLFNESTAAVTSFINVAAADCVIEGNQFDCGATDLEAITWASGARLNLLNNKFYVTANGPDAALEIEAANDGLICKGNLFNGGSATNVWDAAAINSGQAHTNALIDDNVFMYGVAMVVATSVSTSIGVGNQYLMGAASNAGAPQVFYTDLGSTIRDGKSPETPTTLNDAVVTKATAGDVVFVLAGSTATLAAAQALSVAGVSLIGLGEGTSRPQITVNGTVDGLDVTAANVLIKNIYFNEATAGATSNINVGAANCKIEGCHFDLGANDLECITWASGANLKVLNNKAVVTANGPDAFLEIESTNDGLLFEGNILDGGSTTNTWDAAAVNSGQAHTKAIIQHNTFLTCTAMVIATSVSTLVRENEFGVDAYPTASTPISLYVDNGSTARDGLSPATPTTLADALTKARSGVGDKIRLLPGTYTLAATATVNDAAISIGPYLDNGTANVIVTTASDVDLFTVTGANVEIFGIRFLGNAAQTTTPMLISVATGDYGNIHDCWFDSASVASLIAIDIAAGATDWRVSDNHFVGGVASVGYVTSAGGRTIVKRNEFDCTAADAAAIDLSTHATLGSVFAENHIQGDAGANTAMLILDTSAPVQFACYNNIFTGTTSATPFGQDAEYTTMFVNNYCPGSTVAGGTLIDPVA